MRPFDKISISAFLNSKVFCICVYAPFFSNLDRCPLNFIERLDTDIMLLSI